MSEAEWDKVGGVRFPRKPQGHFERMSKTYIGYYQCWAVNVKGQMALLREALPTFNANPDGGAFIITSSVAVRLVLIVEYQGQG